MIDTMSAPETLSKDMMDLLPKTEPKIVDTPVATETPAVVDTPPVEKKEAEPVVTENKTETPAPVSTEAKKEWWESSTKSEEKPADEDKTDYKSEYARLMEDPLLKAIAEAKKSGKNALDALKELEPVNYKAMDLETLASAYGKSKGWSDEDISDEISKLEGKTRTEIENITNTWLSKLEGEQSGKMEKFALTHKETAEKQKQQEQYIQKRFEDDLKAECALMMANEINGVKLTKEHVNDFIKTAVEFSAIREDESINMETIRFAWMGRNMKQFMSAAKSEGASAGRTEVLDEITRHNPNSSQPQRLPEAKKPLTADEQAAALIKLRMG